MGPFSDTDVTQRRIQETRLSGCTAHGQPGGLHSARHECASIESTRRHTSPDNGLNCQSMSRDVEVVDDAGKELYYIISGSYAPDRTELLSPASFKQQVGFVILRVRGETAWGCP